MIKRNTSFNVNVKSMVYQTDKHYKRRDFLGEVNFRNFKKCIFREMKTDFENRLKHQVKINLCTILDLVIQDHPL